jgi:iron complex outermembrane recepter protein
MFSKNIFFIALFLGHFPVLALQLPADSTEKVLQEITIKGFSSNRTAFETGASVDVISKKELQRFGNTTLLPALNLLSGVRMEERSPGSYRISIRGSSLRSPFGVRNVKVYWNDIPLTDASGGTYFNLLEMDNLGKIEVLKGPSSSMYGAGMGGTLLLSNATDLETKGTKEIRTGVVLGSYGMFNNTYSYRVANEHTNSQLSYGHSQNNGFRANSSMKRDVINFRSSYFLKNNNTLNINTLYATIDYKTPGGLTYEQQLENPQQARPATRFLLGAADQEAGIRQRLFSLGISLEKNWGKGWSHTTSWYGSLSHLENPFITNYEVRDEQMVGARTQLMQQKTKSNYQLKKIVGLEWNRNAGNYAIYENLYGEKSKFISLSEVTSNQLFCFVQLEASFGKGWISTLGSSINTQNYNYSQVTTDPKFIVSNFSFMPFSPRVSILKKLTKNAAVFGSVSRGFSPPTTQEFIAGFTNLLVANSLNAETGINYEVGLKGKWFKNKLQATATVFRLEQNNTIVRRLDENEQERFINSGKTNQQGLELSAVAFLINRPKYKLEATGSYTLNDFQFVDYQYDAVDFSGKKLPSIPQQTLVVALDYSTSMGIYVSTLLNFTDKIYLNNANTVSAQPYYLLTARMGWKKEIKRLKLNVFMGGDNLLNQKYSLGNDINAFGNRFFNPAAPRSWNGGISLALAI